MRSAWRGIQCAVCVTGVLHCDWLVSCVVCDGCVPHCDARVLRLSALLSTLFGSVSISLFCCERTSWRGCANVPSFFVAQFERLRVMDDHERRVRLGSCQ